jgi:hypothetical protein
MRRATDQGRGPQEGVVIAREILRQIHGLVQGVQIALLSDDYGKALEVLSDLG